VRILTEEETRWKGLNHYLSLKKKWNDDKYGVYWQRKYSGKPSVGAMVYLCEKWKPTSYEDFYNMYISRCEGIDNLHRGRSLEELEEIAINWQSDVKDFETPLSEYFDAIILHTVVETYVGADFENKAIKAMLDTKKYIIERSSDEEDSAMSIDFKVFNLDRKLLYFIQVKPISFITSNKLHTLKDRVNAFEKHKKGNEAYPGIPYYYLVYDAFTNKWVVNPKKNRCLFEYSELVKSNGDPLRSKYIMRKDESDVLFNNN
jgi:hypothetical protein